MNFANILFIHGRLSQTAWLYMLILAAWAGFHYFRKRKLDGQFFGIVAIGEILMVAQAALGAIMFFGWNIQPGKIVHLLYGTLSILVFPSVYHYTQGGEDRRAAMMWTLAGLFMFGLSLRAIGTAH